jgi:hypothetical protein
MSEATMQKRFEELVPWFVNGTLSPPDAEWVTLYLREHPEATAELRWWESMQARIREDAPAVSPDVGYDRLLARIGASASALTSAPAAQAASDVRPGVTAPRRASSPGGGWRDWFSSWGFTPRFAFASALIVLQAGVIGKLLLDRSATDGAYSDVRGTPGQVRIAGTLMKVSFRPDARENEIRMLLVAIGGSIVEGPTQLGDYVVSVPTERAAAAGQQLVGSGVVDSVNVIGEAGR